MLLKQNIILQINHRLKIKRCCDIIQKNMDIDLIKDLGRVYGRMISGERINRRDLLKGSAVTAALLALGLSLPRSQIVSAHSLDNAPQPSSTPNLRPPCFVTIGSSMVDGVNMTNVIRVNPSDPVPPNNDGIVKFYTSSSIPNNLRPFANSSEGTNVCFGKLDDGQIVGIVLHPDGCNSVISTSFDRANNTYTYIDGGVSVTFNQSTNQITFKQVDNNVRTNKAGLSPSRRVLYREITPSSSNNLVSPTFSVKAAATVVVTNPVVKNTPAATVNPGATDSSLKDLSASGQGGTSIEIEPLAIGGVIISILTACYWRYQVMVKSGIIPTLKKPIKQ
jgi:hypothetical protein